MLELPAVTTPSDADRETAIQVAESIADGWWVLPRKQRDEPSAFAKHAGALIAAAIAQARAEGEQRLREYEHMVMTGRSEQHDQLVARAEQAKQETTRLMATLRHARISIEDAPCTCTHTDYPCSRCMARDTIDSTLAAQPASKERENG